jgi:hypothetical protein
MGTVSVDGTQPRFDGAAVRRVQELNEMFSAGEIEPSSRQRAQQQNAPQRTQKPVVVPGNPVPAKVPPVKASLNGEATFTRTPTSWSNANKLKAEVTWQIDPKTKLTVGRSSTGTQGVGDDGKRIDTSKTDNSAKLTGTLAGGGEWNLGFGLGTTWGTSVGNSTNFSADASREFKFGDATKLTSKVFLSHSSETTDGVRTEQNKIGVEGTLSTNLNLAKDVSLELGATAGVFFTGPQPATDPGSNIGVSAKLFANAKYEFSFRDDGLGNKLGGFVKASGSFELNGLVGGTLATPVTAKTSLSAGIGGETVWSATGGKLKYSAELGAEGSFPNDGSSQSNTIIYGSATGSLELGPNTSVNLNLKYTGLSQQPSEFKVGVGLQMFVN